MWNIKIIISIRQLLKLKWQDNCYQQKEMFKSRANPCTFSWHAAVGSCSWIESNCLYFGKSSEVSERDNDFSLQFPSERSWVFQKEKQFVLFQRWSLRDTKIWAGSNDTRNDSGPNLRADILDLRSELLDKTDLNRNRAEDLIPHTPTDLRTAENREPRLNIPGLIHETNFNLNYAYQ